MNQDTAFPDKSPMNFDGSAWASELDVAIRSNDIPGMWRLADLHTDKEEGCRQLVDRVPRIAYQMNGKTYFNEMFLMPVVAPAGSDAITNADVWREASYCINETFDTWLLPNTFKMVFQGVRPYNHVGTWQPAVIRKHLQRAIPNETVGQIQYNMEIIQLPEGAPHLGFISMVLTMKSGWPALPPTDTLRDRRLRKVVALALHNSADPAIATPMVLAPDRIQYAVTDGLALWLDSLNSFCEITGWGISLRHQSPDVVLVTLRLDAEPKWTQFAIRKHQVGVEGLTDILTLLSAMAPNMDPYDDLPRPVHRSVSLEL